MGGGGGGGGQGLTKPRAYRGTALMWVCGPAELSKVLWVICKTPPLLVFHHHLPHTHQHHPTSSSTAPLLFPSFPFPPSHGRTFLHPLCPAEFSPLTHTHTLPLLLHTYISRVACTSTGERMHAHMHARAPHGTRASSLCLLSKQELAALVTDNKVVNGWFWRNSAVALSQQWHYSFIQWIPKVLLSWASSCRHTIASLITLSSEKREVNGWHFATPCVLLPITIETQIRPD